MADVRVDIYDRVTEAIARARAKAEEMGYERELDELAFEAAQHASPEPLYLLEVCGPSDSGLRAGEYTYRNVGTDLPTLHGMDITTEALRRARLDRLADAAAMCWLEMERITDMELYDADPPAEDCDSDMVTLPPVVLGGRPPKGADVVPIADNDSDDPKYTDRDIPW